MVANSARPLARSGRRGRRFKSCHSDRHSPSNPAPLPAPIRRLPRSGFTPGKNQWFLRISSSISSIECGRISNVPKPGISGIDTLSICISSTWFRVIGGLGNNSEIPSQCAPGSERDRKQCRLHSRRLSEAPCRSRRGATALEQSRPG